MRELLIVLFAVSGQLDAVLRLRMDLTLAIGVIMLVDLITTLLRFRVGVIVKSRTYLVYMLLLFFWAIFTTSYTMSESYYVNKLLSLFAVIFGFSYVLAVRRKLLVERVVMWHHVYVLFLVMMYLPIILQEGSLNSIIFNVESSTGLSDYLSSVNYICISLIAIYYSKNVYIFLLTFLGVAPVLFYLGGRGDLLFLILILLPSLLKELRVLIPLLGSAFFLNMAFENFLLFKRIESIFTGTDQSLMNRLYLFDRALEIVQFRPILGVGFGGFGNYVYGDDRRSYAHNLFLESWSELGIIGFFLICVLVVMGFKTLRDEKIISALILFIFLGLLKSSTWVDSKYLLVFIGFVIAVPKSCGLRQT